MVYLCYCVLIEFSIKVLGFSGRTMSEVKIVYKGESYEVDIEDISPEDLQECFGLPKVPKFLLDENANKMINCKYWRSKLKVGCIYRIKEQGINSDTSGKNEVDEEEVAKTTTGIDDSFRDIVLHSLIASTAVYKMEHKEDDEKFLKQYMYDQMENHYFEYIIPSKHGENFYLIAKEVDANRIYVAFRGSKDLLDWKYNLQVMLSFLFSFIYLLSVTHFSSPKQSFSSLIIKGLSNQ